MALPAASAGHPPAPSWRRIPPTACIPGDLLPSGSQTHRQLGQGARFIFQDSVFLLFLKFMGGSPLLNKLYNCRQKGQPPCQSPSKNPTFLAAKCSCVTHLPPLCLLWGFRLEASPLSRLNTWLSAELATCKAHKDRLKFGQQLVPHALATLC